VKIQRFAIAAIVASVFFIFIDTWISPLVFPDGTAGLYLMPRAHPPAAPGIASFVITGLLLAYIFPIGYRGGKHFAEGLRFGMLLGVLASLPANLRLYAAADVRFDSLLTVILWTIITWGIAGAIIAAIYGESLSDKTA